MDRDAPPQVEKNRDNILPRIMASSEGHTSLFERELSKYDGLKGAVLLVTLLTCRARQSIHVPQRQAVIGPTIYGAIRV